MSKPDKILVCASIAYDSIMVFAGRFREHILPDQVHILNVSFLVPTLRQEFGGVAGNIAYNLALLGAHGVPLGTIGDDGQTYVDRLASLGIDGGCVLRVPGTRTAQAFITTDLDDNQISAFHPGAMSHSQLAAVPVDPDIALALVGPDGREGMLAHARALSERGIPFVFDPGQAMPLFDGEELLWFIGKARYLAVNDYEGKLLESKTGRLITDLARDLDAVIVTHGGQGSEIHAGGRRIPIPPAPVARVVDPTGCGDAYRAGLLHGIHEGLAWEVTGRLASVLGAMKIEHSGAQNHTGDRQSVCNRYRESFGEKPW
jgi:adenosine kinase